MITELGMIPMKHKGDVGGKFSSFSTFGDLPHALPQFFHFSD